MSTTIPESFGANPVRYQWVIVRGDTAVFRLEFLEDDEVTFFDTTGWTYTSTVYDVEGDSIDELDIDAGEGFVVITIPPDISEQWGTGSKGTVAELPFDVQVEFDGIVWTPVVGTIKVIADITGGSL